MDFGAITVEFIVLFAELLVSKGAPGWVAIALALGFVGALFSLDSVIGRQTGALAFLKGHLAEAGRGPHFAGGISRIDETLSEARKRNDAFEAVATAWGEYRETHVIDDTDGAPLIRNAVRPSVFFNLDDLDFGPGWLRILPNSLWRSACSSPFWASLQRSRNSRSGSARPARWPPRRWRISLALRRRSSSCR